VPCNAAEVIVSRDAVSLRPDSRTAAELSPYRLLTPAEMGEADRRAIAAGVPGTALMEAAGRAVARAVAVRWTPRPVAVLCGPGNNGGDGYVAAVALREAGWPVRVAALGDPKRLSGDAAHFAALWGEAPEALSPGVLKGAALAVDALFGAGLDRPLGGAAAEMVAALRGSGLPVVAVDVPSGLDGATGRVRGGAAPADLTVTFFRLKPGHKLLPGRDLCGEVELADIGIPAATLSGLGAGTWVNRPGLWRLPELTSAAHKYTRGHLLVIGGEMTGATRLATRAARRAGVGLVTVVCPPGAYALFAADAPGAIVLADATEAGEGVFRAALADPRRNAVLIGPGHGDAPRLRGRVGEILAAGRAAVLDADALSAFADEPDALFRMISGPAVLTPHAGEFARLFPDLAALDHLTAARAAAARSGAVVLLKGSDTVVAAPDGAALINDNAPPTLATAGAGDVLAGIVAGLLAQGMPPLAAAAAAVWMHGDAARRFGPGLIAEDIPEMLPPVLRGLNAN
jgi:NAD(P)H-hydrate epimerase